MEISNKIAYKKAKKRVEKLKGFYHHLFSYLWINVFLVALNLYKNPENLWCLWIIFGWGICLVPHALKVFVPDIFFGKDWERRKIKELMNNKE